MHISKKTPESNLQGGDKLHGDHESDVRKKQHDLIRTDIGKVAERWASRMYRDLCDYVLEQGHYSPSLPEKKRKDFFQPYYFVLDNSLHHNKTEHAPSFHMLTNELFLGHLGLKFKDVLGLDNDTFSQQLAIEDHAYTLNADIYRHHDETTVSGVSYDVTRLGSLAVATLDLDKSYSAAQI